MAGGRETRVATFENAPVFAIAGKTCNSTKRSVVPWCRCPGHHHFMDNDTP
jgi:hypothetical protein